jgi:hypothetical protein
MNHIATLQAIDGEGNGYMVPESVDGYMIPEIDILGMPEVSG